MINSDTIKLLRECDAGIKMGVSSINEIIEDTEDARLKNLLASSRNEHVRLSVETEEMLDSFGDEGKSPSPMAKKMSWIKTNVMMAIDAGDNTIADLITDGCNMGVKSLSRYLNQYKAADERSKDIAKKLISMESDLAVGMRDYL